MTPIQELLTYIKTANAVTFLPEQLVKLIEDKYMPKEKMHIIDAFNSGEMNIWNKARDEHFQYEGGNDYFIKNYNK
jgi:hypothetical protein